MILLKVIIYLLVFFPFLRTSSGYMKEVDYKPDPLTMSSKILEPLTELVKAEFISDENAFYWRSLNINNHISSQLQKQCPKSYSRLENVILKNYNAGYRKALETNNENWMRVKIKEVIEGIKSCRRELRGYYVNFSHEIVGPLHRAYNLDNPGSVYNKDEFRFGCSFCELFTRDAGSERFEVFGIKKYVG